MADAPPPYSAVTIDKSGPYPELQAGYPPAAGYGATQPGPYPPAAGGYQMGPPGDTATNTVIVSQPPLTVVQVFHKTPVRILCPHCHADIITATRPDIGTFSWLICIILCLLGCNMGCCLIPFCVEDCQDVVHSCPNCHQHISRWGRM